MTTTLPNWQPRASHRMAEVRRCYVLFDGIRCNLPRSGSDGEPGAWDHARGVLAEVASLLRATPVALHYRELETGGLARLPVGTEVTAVVRDDGELITVVHRHESAPYGARGDFWRLTVNGSIPESGLAKHPPSLPRIATLVWQHLLYRRPLAPVIPLHRAKSA